VNKPFEYDVKLVPLKVTNCDQTEIRAKLMAVPYLLYEVETLANGDKIVINKPGGKRNFGRLARNDFMVFIYTSSDKTLWLISHDEIKSDLQSKYDKDPETTSEIIKGLLAVCRGDEPDTVLKNLNIKSSAEGLSIETIYKVYKWIWGQEDCNYPTGKGRWLSMDGLLEHFKLMALKEESAV